jgi:hypothetical protein
MDGWIVAGQGSGISVDGIIGNVMAGDPVRIELHQH